MKIDILTLFPEMFNALNYSIIGKAQEKKIIHLNTVDFRKFSNNKHNQVDDYPYGGGHGMILKVEPIYNALNFLGKNEKTKVILLCPQGEKFNQKKAEELSKEEHLVFICGHYEGYDERIRDFLVTDEISLGDFVLTGGELAAMTIIDSITRLIPNVLSKEESHMEDTFTTGLLEYSQYTRPREFKGMKVPEVLFSGNHKKIKEYKLYNSLMKTYNRRPDLLKKYTLNEEEKTFLDRIQKNKLQNK